MDEGGAHVALGNRCPTHHHRTQRRRLVVRLGENPCNRHLRRDQGTSSRRYATSLARALQYACVEQDTTSPTVSAPTATRRTDHVRSTKASDFCFLVLLFLTPTVRHANIWGILRVRTPSAAKIGSVFDRCSASSLWNYCHPGRTRSHERVVHRDSPANAPSPATTTTGGMRSQLA